MKVEALRAKPVNNLANPRAKHAMTAWIISMPISDLCRDWSVIVGGGDPSFVGCTRPVQGKITRKMRLPLDGFFRGPKPVACAGVEVPGSGKGLLENTVKRMILASGRRNDSTQCGSNLVPPPLFRAWFGPRLCFNRPCRVVSASPGVTHRLCFLGPGSPPSQAHLPPSLHTFPQYCAGVN